MIRSRSSIRRTVRRRRQRLSERRCPPRKNTRRISDLDEELFKHGALSRRDLEQAQTDAINADADSDAALQQVHSLGVDDKTIDDLQHHLISTNLPGYVRSPINGTLVEKLVSPGQLLQAANTPCFTVADLSQVWVTAANIFERDMASIAVGDAAQITTSADTNSIPCAIDNISAILDPNTRSIGVRIVVKNPVARFSRSRFISVSRSIPSVARDHRLARAPTSAVLAKR